ncbi:MAG: hypothetical protein ABH834_08065 [Candidatus Altiarchaeota archaeon]
MNPKKTPTLSDIQVILHHKDDSGKTQKQLLTRDEIMSLNPNKPKTEILSELKKKSKKLEEQLRKPGNGAER